MTEQILVYRNDGNTRRAGCRSGVEGSASDRPKLVYIATHVDTARGVMTGQLRYMRERGFDVLLIVSPNKLLESVAAKEGVRVAAVPMQREISPWSDLRALWQLCKILRLERPDLVNAGTPKAGLLGMLAAFLTRVPGRFYTLRGLRLETCAGWKRWMLSVAERVAASCSHRVICVSESLRELYVRFGLSSPKKTLVLRSGSSNGVNRSRFETTPFNRERTRELREQLQIPATARVIGFVGRLTRDKGLPELLVALDSLSADFRDLFLVVVGGYEAGDPVPGDVVQRIQEHPRIRTTGAVLDASPYYALFDLVAFPSHREGFPNVPLEAGAAGLPVVGFDATGTRDAVQDGVTGTLVARGDTKSFAKAIAMYLQDDELRHRHGAAGRLRVSREFRQEAVWESLLQLYEKTLVGWTRTVQVATPLDIGDQKTEKVA